MEKDDDNSFDTDLDDQETDPTASRLSFKKKLFVHRSNRLTETFGQVHLPTKKSVRNDARVPSEAKTPSACSPATRIQLYEETCEQLDITADWQLRELLKSNTICIIDRSFSFNDMRAFAAAIGNNLESLTLHSVGLTSRAVHLLAQALRQCNHLTFLDLSENRIGREGFRSLVSTIQDLPSLLYLSLIRCGIQDSYGSCIGDLCRHETLLEINLSGNELEANACILIGNALIENTSLIYLNLSWNRIRSVASIALLRGLEVNKSLVELNISWNGLGYDGSIAIRRILLVNKILERLNISNCSIDWTSATLLSEAFAKNRTLQHLNISYNPLTTHGVQILMKGLSVKTSAVSMFDVSGLTVFSTDVRLAEEIAKRRTFIMKYDCEIPVHDVLGRQTVAKPDSMRKIIQHIDGQNWRTLEYFRMLDKKSQLKLESETVTSNILKSGVQLDHDDIQSIHRRLTQRSSQPITYKHLNTLINEQRQRDRSLKAREEAQVKEKKKRNRKMLQTVSHHFPGIEIVTKLQKHQDAIEELARPRVLSSK